MWLNISMDAQAETNLDLNRGGVPAANLSLQHSEADATRGVFLEASQHIELDQGATASPASTDSSMWRYINHLNVFRFCKFLKILGNIMVVIVLGIVGLVWYTMTVAVYGPRLVSGSAGGAIFAAIVLLVFNTLVVMLSWSYLAAVGTDPGGVPDGWHPFPDTAMADAELQRMAYSNYYIDRRDPRRPRYCKRCNGWKPERAHHCSVLGRCVLKMDHYCIWVVNTVGLLNYKYFVQFMAYTFLACLVALVVLIHPMIEFFKGQQDTAAALAFISAVICGAFTACLLGFLIMHSQLINANCTTIEMYEKERMHPWPYNKGWRRNWEEVLGRSWRQWLIPRHTPEERRQLLESCLSPRLLSNYLQHVGNGV